MTRRAAAIVFAGVFSACAQAGLDRSEDGVLESTGTGSTGADASLTSTSAGPSTAPTDPATSIDASGPGSEGADSEGSSSADGSSGEPQPTCGNGEREPGEVCFGALQTVAFDAGAIDVTIGSVDDDTILDLVVAAGGRVGLRSGDGVGGFGNLESLELGGTAVGIVTDDLDHDDVGDGMALAQPLATVVRYSSYWELVSHTGNEQALDDRNDLVVGAFDDDTYELDVIYTSASQVVMQVGEHPAFTYLLRTPVSLPTSGTAPTGIAKAAFVFDGDNVEDVVFVHRNSNLGELVRGGDLIHGGSFPVCPDGAIGARRIGIGDFDGDGFQDLVVTCEGGFVTVVIGQDDGSFAAPVPIELADAFGVTVTDVDGQGEIDVAIASPSLGTVTVLVADEGTLVPAGTLEAGEPIGDISSGDIDGDGVRDLAVAIPSGAVGLFRSDP